MERVVLVKGRFGMGNRLAVVLSAARYARETGRSLMVDWNDHTYYSTAVDDVFTTLFSSPAVVPLDIGSLSGRSVYPPEWASLLDAYRDDVDAEIMPYRLAWSKPPDEVDADAAIAAERADVVVVTRDGARNRFAEDYRQVRLSPSVQGRVDACAADHDWAHTIGVQIRNGNGEPYLTPADTAWFHERIGAELAEDGTASVFLATDSVDVLFEFEQTYPGLVHVPKWYPPPGAGSMHHHASCPDRFVSGVDALTDIWLLARCAHLLICDGGFGRTARLVAESPPASVEVYPGKIYASVEEKADWDNPI